MNWVDEGKTVMLLTANQALISRIMQSFKATIYFILTLTQMTHCNVRLLRDTDTSYHESWQILQNVKCDIFYDVKHHLTLASCWLSCSVKALVSQCSGCSGLRLLARLPRNRWGDRSLGEGNRDTIRGEHWLTILLKAGCLWEVLGKKSDQGAGTKNLMNILYI